jgi:hypothetical protein
MELSELLKVLSGILVFCAVIALIVAIVLLAGKKERQIEADERRAEVRGMHGNGDIREYTSFFALVFNQAAVNFVPHMRLFVQNAPLSVSMSRPFLVDGEEVRLEMTVSLTKTEACDDETLRTDGFVEPGDAAVETASDQTAKEEQAGTAAGASG